MMTVKKKNVRIVIKNVEEKHIRKQNKKEEMQLKKVIILFKI